MPWFINDVYEPQEQFWTCKFTLNFNLNEKNQKL